MFDEQQRDVLEMQSKLIQYDERMASFVKTAKDHIEKAALELHMQA